MFTMEHRWKSLTQTLDLVPLQVNMTIVWSEFIIFNTENTRAAIKIRRCGFCDATMQNCEGFRMAGRRPAKEPSCEVQKSAIELKRNYKKCSFDYYDNTTMYVSVTPEGHDLYPHYKYMVTIDAGFAMDLNGNENEFQILGEFTTRGDGAPPELQRVVYPHALQDNAYLWFKDPVETTGDKNTPLSVTLNGTSPPVSCVGFRCVVDTDPSAMIEGFRYFMGLPGPATPDSGPRIVDMDGLAFEGFLATEHRFRTEAEDTDGPAVVWMSLAEEDVGENVPLAIHTTGNFEDDGSSNAVVWTSDEGGLLRAEVAEWLDAKILRAFKDKEELHLQYFEVQASLVGRKVEKLGIVAEKAEWLNRNDQECRDPCGMLPLVLGMSTALTVHNDRHPCHLSVSIILQVLSKLRRRNLANPILSSS